MDTLIKSEKKSKISASTGVSPIERPSPSGFPGAVNAERVCGMYSHIQRHRHMSACVKNIKVDVMFSSIHCKKYLVCIVWPYAPLTLDIERDLPILNYPYRIIDHQNIVNYITVLSKKFGLK